MGTLDSSLAKGEINNKMMDCLADFIKEHLGEEVILIKFVVVLETLEPDDRYLAGYAAPGMKLWETVGMLDWASNFEYSNEGIGDNEN